MKMRLVCVFDTCLELQKVSVLRYCSCHESST